jgi:hypothetical protein
MTYKYLAEFGNEEGHEYFPAVNGYFSSEEKVRSFFIRNLDKFISYRLRVVAEDSDGVLRYVRYFNKSLLKVEAKNGQKD